MKKYKLSVVLAVRNLRNKGYSFKNCLISLKNQDYNNKMFEVIVVNYGGPNNIKSIIDSIGAENIRYIEVHDSGIFNESRSKNIGIKASKGNIVLCTNADILFTKSALRVLVNVFDQNNNFLFQARRRELPKNYPIDNKFDILVNGSINDEEITLSSPSATGDFQAMKKEYWLQLKGYDERMVGWGAMDVDILERAKKIGLEEKWIDDESLKIYHQYHEINPDLVGLKHNVNLMLMNSGDRYIVKNKDWGSISRIYRILHCEFGYKKYKGYKDKLHRVEVNTKSILGSKSMQIKKSMETAIKSNYDYLACFYENIPNYKNIFKHENLIRYDIQLIYNSYGTTIGSIYNRRTLAILNHNKLWKFGANYDNAIEIYAKRLKISVNKFDIKTTIGGKAKWSDKFRKIFSSLLLKMNDDLNPINFN